ncbi:MAG: DUF983 domain-containing protein [Actinobacteria bacterium]|nr:DUF983 domain-containing protein [Actinomycetota bacterium]
MTNTEFPHPHPVRLLLRGLLRRCPRCGAGRLFPSWFRMVDRCPRCGMAFEREEGFFLGAFVVNFGLILVLLAVYIGVGVALTLPDPPPGKLAVGGMVLATLVPVAFYPFSRTFWSAIDLWMKPLEPEEVAAAQGSTGVTTAEP